MTTRNLDRVFAPRAVAVIGASGRPRAVGHIVLRNMQLAQFPGTLMPVNPSLREIDGLRVWPDIASLRADPDLAVIATPPDTVPDLISQLARRNCAGAIIITAGFHDGGAEAGARRRQAMLDAARPALLRIIGPNCLGMLAPGAKLNASFSHVQAANGAIACFTQSGAIAAALLDWAAARGIGLRYLVSVGDMADVDFGDLLDFVAADPEIRAILLYVESIAGARKFMSAARAAARERPVVVVKSGRHPAASAAAQCHTGALAGSDAVYDAAFKRAGLIRVAGLDELFSAAETLSRAGIARGGRTTILTNGGGFGVLAADAVLDAGGRLTELTPETRAKLDSAMPPIWSHGNPVDIIGDADAERYQAALAALLSDSATDMVLALNCPTGVASSMEAAEGTISAWQARRVRPGPKLLACWLTTQNSTAILHRFNAAGIPAFSTLEGAVAGCAQLAEYARNQHLMLKVPERRQQESGAVDRAMVHAVLQQARSQGREWLDAATARSVLGSYGVPVVRAHPAATSDEAAEIADTIGGRVALKIRSPSLTHKSDVGGVTLNLSGGAAVRAAAEAMAAHVHALRPEAKLEGFTVEPMVSRREAFELIIGASTDPTFGPVILFGHGGVGVEAIGDTALGLPPLDHELALSLMGRTRVGRLSHGFRGHPPCDIDAIARVLIAVAELMLDNPEIRELDINPLFSDASGIIAVDTRIRLDDPGARVASAIVPYPRELETSLTLPGGQQVFLRPIRPDDAALLQRMHAVLAPEDVRARFHGALRVLEGRMLARLTQIDYDREIALLAFAAGDELPLGVVRLYADPDNIAGEFAVIVRSDWHGRGLGTALLRRLIEIADKRGLCRIVGSVLSDNAAMLRLAHEVGFETTEHAGEEVTIVYRFDRSD
jgi:acetyltransferase